MLYGMSTSHAGTCSLLLCVVVHDRSRLVVVNQSVYKWIATSLMITEGFTVVVACSSGGTSTA